MGKLAVVCAVGAGLLLGGCQAVNTTSGGAVGGVMADSFFIQVLTQAGQFFHSPLTRLDLQQGLLQLLAQGLDTCLQVADVLADLRQAVEHAPLFFMPAFPTGRSSPVFNQLKSRRRWAKSDGG